MVGNICYTGNIGKCSDRRFKRNIEPLKDSLNKVLKLRATHFEWNEEDFATKNFGEGVQVGFISQEIEDIYPEAVFTDSEGFKYVDHSSLTPILVEAIKEQHQLIEQQKSTVDDLRIRLKQLEATVESLNP